MLITLSIPWERRGRRCVCPETKSLSEVLGATWGMPTFGRASASSPVRGNIDLWQEARSILGTGVPS